MKYLLLTFLVLPLSIRGATLGVSYDSTSRNVLQTDLDYVGATGNFTTSLALNSVSVSTVEQLTWFTGSQATRTWTFSLSGATDPVITFGNNLVNVTTGVLQYGGNTVGTAANNLSFFAATTSLQLLGVISDETGTGALVFGSSPTIVTPTIASFANATHTHQNAAGGGTLDAAAIAAGTMATARLGSGTANSSTFLRGDSTWASAGGGASDNWVASGTTNSELPGIGSAYELIGTNAVRGGSFIGIGTTADSRVDVPDDDGSAYAGFQANNTTTTSVNLIFPAAPFTGLSLFTASGTNWTPSQAAANTDYLPPADPAITGAATFGNGATSSGTLRILEDSDNGSNYSELTVPSALGGNRTVTFPDATTVIPIITQTITVSGPSAARTWTVPDANFTIARTDAANSFTGIQTITASPGIITGNGATGPGIVRLLEDTDSGANYGQFTVPSALSGDRTYTGPDASGTVVLEDNTATLTGKTYDAGGTGNTLLQLKQLNLQRPDYGDGAGAVPQTNTFNVSGLMHYTFSGNAETNENWVVYEFDCPSDLNTAVEITARFAFLSGGTDADDYVFHLTYGQVAPGAAYPTGTGIATSPIVMTITPTTAANGDLQSSGAVTLTGWAAALTPGRAMTLRIARLQNAQDDGARDVQLVITYGSTL